MPKRITQSVNGLLLLGWVAVLFLSSHRPLAVKTIHHSEPLASADSSAAQSESQRIVASIGQLPPLKPPTPLDYKLSWQFALGQSTEGVAIRAVPQSMNWQPVAVPHNYVAPNTPFWYRTKLKLSGDCVLEGRGDDGFQVFVNGRKLEQPDSKPFLINALGDSTELVVRVLNGGGAGGLRSIQLYAAEPYQTYRTRLDWRSRLSALSNKLVRLQTLSSAQLKRVQQAVADLNEKTLQRAEKALAVYPLLVVEPYLQEPEANGIRVLWETDVACSAQLELGNKEAGFVQRLAATGETLHECQLTGLEPGKTYQYRVVNRGIRSKQYSFGVPKPDSTFAFSVWADSHVGFPGATALPGLVQQMQRFPLAFSIGLGDVVNNGSQPDDWRNLFRSLQPLGAQIPIYFIPGNHDHDGYYHDLKPLLWNRYVRNIPDPTYTAWTYGNARFVAVDPNGEFPLGISKGSKQHDWLMQEVQSDAWKKAQWHFLLIHQPPLSEGPVGSVSHLSLQTLVDSLAQAVRIDVVISGHIHAYYRFQRQLGNHHTTYLIVNTAGGPLSKTDWKLPVNHQPVPAQHQFNRVQVTPTHISFEARDKDGRVLDAFIINKPSPLVNRQE